GGNEAPGIDGWVGGILLRVVSGEQAGFHVGHDPRASTSAASPGGRRAEVGGFHGACADSAAVGRGVPVVKAAAAVVVRAVDDVVDALGFVADCDAGGIVIAEPHAWHDVYAVSLVAHDRDRRHVRDRLR